MIEQAGGGRNGNLPGGYFYSQEKIMRSRRYAPCIKQKKVAMRVFSDYAV